MVSPGQVVPKKGGMTVVRNERNELIPQRTVTGWRMCIDYQMLNKATRKYHFPLPFIDEMLGRLAKKESQSVWFAHAILLLRLDWSKTRWRKQ